MPVTRQTIAANVYAGTTLTQRESKEAVDRLIGMMLDVLSGGECILITGFGKFQLKEKKARRGHNPQTSEPMEIRARRIVTYKCSRQLRRRINGDGLSAASVAQDD